MIDKVVKARQPLEKAVKRKGIESTASLDEVVPY